MTPDNDQDRGLTEDEALLIAGLPAELITRIDDALLAESTHRFQKVARIVGQVMQSFSDGPSGIPDIYYAQRIAKLVEAGLLESQGNLGRMRFSEVRLPGWTMKKPAFGLALQPAVPLMESPSYCFELKPS